MFPVTPYIQRRRFQFRDRHPLSGISSSVSCSDAALRPDQRLSLSFALGYGDRAGVGEARYASLPVSCVTVRLGCVSARHLSRCGTGNRERGRVSSACPIASKRGVGLSCRQGDWSWGRNWER